MSVAASVALAVAERVERAVGTRAGLAAYRALVDNAADDALRGRAILAALRCAIALRDVEAVAALTAAWSSIERGVWDEAIVTACKGLVGASLVPEAVTLAGAEVARHPSARALYLHARCLELALDRAVRASAAASSSAEGEVLRVRTTDAFAAAARRAAQEGHVALGRAARVRRVTYLASRWETLEAAIAEAKDVDPKGASAVEICALARVLLLSPSRFVRAGAIASLGGVIEATGAEAGGARAGVALGALGIAARHADAMGAALSSLELDRLLAILGSRPITRVFPRAAAALRAAAAIDASRDDGDLATALTKSLDAEIALASVHARARDIVRGRFEPSPTAMAPRDDVPVVAAAWSMILDLAVALRDEAPTRAAFALRALGERASRGDAMPRQALGIAARALATSMEGDAELRVAAVDFFAALLRRPSASAPPGGWLALAPLFARAERDDLADLARRAAAVAREPGAAAALALVLTRSAWQLAAQGERLAAIAKLREAKGLAPAPPGTVRS